MPGNCENAGFLKLYTPELLGGFRHTFVWKSTWLASQVHSFLNIFAAKVTLLSKSKEVQVEIKPEQVISDIVPPSNRNSTTDLTMRAEETVHAENDDGRNPSQQTSILKYLRRG